MIIAGGPNDQSFILRMPVQTSEKVRQEGFADNRWKPALDCHPIAVVLTTAASGEFLFRKAAA